MRRLRWFFGVFLCTVDLASGASITSGEFQFGPGTQFGPGFGTFVLIGDTVNISGGVTSVVGRIPDFICNPLNGIDCTISLSAASVFGQIVGVQSGKDEKESLLEFFAPVRTITEAGVVTAPFTFAGKYCLTDPADRNLPVVPCLTYYDNLVGAGTVFFTVTPFTAVVGGQTLALLRSGGARYVFEPPAVPVPEPATLLLIASGLSAAGVRRWRRRL